ncbi:MAG: DNRLRE domain-containing protein [Anaerolineae bacterium]|nr:DNRLRE domain-containing protein [Anaerolineae bacterium]
MAKEQERELIAQWAGRGPLSEDISRRSANAGHFRLGDNTYIAICHAKTVHYESAPGANDWDEVDEHLTAHANGWRRERNYWQVEIADNYAAPWPVTVQRRGGFELKHKAVAVGHMARDRTLTMLQKAQASAATRIAVADHADTILYPQVFTDVDILYHLGNDRLSKEVVISEAAKQRLRQTIAVQGLDAHGYLALALRLNFRGGGWSMGLRQGEETEGDIRLLPPDGQKHRGRDRLPRPAVWDGRGFFTPPPPMLTRLVNLPEYGPTLLYLLPLDWLRESVGDVAIDPAYYGGTEDGHIFGINILYATARATSTGGNDTAITAYIGQTITSGTYYVYRTYLSFDTSSIPDAATVTAATLYVCAAYDYSTTNFLIQCYRYAWSEPLLDYREANYDGAYGASATLEGTLRNTAYGWSDGTYYNMAVSPAGINKAGDSKYTLVSKEDVDNSEPTTDEYVLIRTADYSGTSSDPYLSVIYTEEKRRHPAHYMGEMAIV